MRQFSRTARVAQTVGKRLSVFNGASLVSPVQYSKLPMFLPRHLATITEKLDNLGDSIKTAVLVSWAKQPGDLINEDDVIAVVETDKVTLDIRASKKGKFIAPLSPAGSEVAVGAPLYTIDTDATGATAPAAAAATQPAAAAPAAVPAPAASKSERVTVPVPIMGESITQGVLAKWLVATNDSVAADDVVGSIETDKVNVEVRSPSSGTVVELFAKEGDEVTVGNPLFAIVAGAAAAKPAKAAAAPAAAAPVAKAAAAPAPAAKAAAAPAPAAAPTVAVKAAPAKAAAPVPEGAVAGTFIGGDRGETRVQMSRMRQRIAQRLKDSQNTAAMLTTFQEIDMGYLIDLRNKHKDDFEKKHKVKLGFMSAFVKAATAALQEIPAVNAVIDDATHEIIYRNYVDVSVAVASPTGLVVPVLRNTQDLSFADIEKAIAHYGEKAKTGKIQLEDMTGGTFTISNGGVFGSLFGTPIINPPQSAILGMHATKLRPAVVNGKVEARQMMYVALTYDHRLIDGREAVTFLKSIQSKIEDPTKLLLSI